jgi:L,D-transpeptidase ErfK/SrfK
MTSSPETNFFGAEAIMISMKKFLSIFFCLLPFALPSPGFGWSWGSAVTTLFEPLTPGPVIGQNQLYRLGEDETLIELARRAGIGYQALTAANPGIDPWLPPPGKDVLLPYSAILPPESSPGITVNLAEFRLFHLWREEDRVKIRSYPIGIGVEGWETPEREFAITAKVENPGWTAPASIRRERPDHPVFIPPGPDNPLGEFWLHLADGYGIHGTNRPFGVGRRVSAGCLRLYPEDIRELFARVQIGTPVRVIYHPIKMGVEGDTLMIEVHRDYLERISDPLEEALARKRTLGWVGGVDLSALIAALTEARGIPVPIGTR